MKLNGVTYIGPKLGSPEILQNLPPNHGSLLDQLNGFVLFGGALHVRGACDDPSWHSLDAAWNGEAAFHRLYPTVKAHWVPFAEDCVGDQFFIAEGTILRLEAETGEVHETGMTLPEFMDAVQADPMATLQPEPLIQFRQDKGDLPAGQLILAYPPFCTEEASAGVSLSAVEATQVHRFHAELAAKLQPNGQQVQIKIVE